MRVDAIWTTRGRDSARNKGSWKTELASYGIENSIELQNVDKVINTY